MMAVEEYLRTSFDRAEWVWVIDQAQEDRRGAVCQVLRTENPGIEIPLDRF
jgi:hypothetical protein